MRIVILGGNGRIGSAIFHYMRAKLSTAEIVACTRKKTEDKNFFPFDPFEDDWSKLGTVDVLINAIGAIETGSKEAMYEVHLGLAEKMLENRQRIGDPLTINISALGAGTGHSTPFLDSKGRADELLLQSANTFIIRPSIVCMPGTMMVEKIKMLLGIAKFMGGLLFMPAAFIKTRIQPVMAGDIAALVERIILDPPAERIINAGGPGTFTVGELIHKAAEIKGNKVKLIGIPTFFSDILVGGIVTRILPMIINRGEYALLREDNIAGDALEELLGRNAASILPFWERSFR